MFYSRWGHMNMEIVGENGFMKIDNLAEYLTIYSKHLPRNPTWMNYGIDSNQRMINEFVASIREEIVSHQSHGAMVTKLYVWHSPVTNPLNPTNPLH